MTFNGFNNSLVALPPRGPTAACLAAPGPRLTWGLGRPQWRSCTPLNQNFLSHRRRGKYFLASRSVTRTASQRFSTLTDGWPASCAMIIPQEMHLLNSMAAKFPRTRTTNISFTSTPLCKDFFVRSGNTSLLETRFKPRAQVMDVHDRTSQHFLHSSPILRGTLKGKDQIVIPNNRSILHTDTPPRIRKLTTSQLTTDIN